MFAKKKDRVAYHHDEIGHQIDFDNANVSIRKHCTVGDL